MATNELINIFYQERKHSVIQAEKMKPQHQTLTRIGRQSQSLKRQVLRGLDLRRKIHRNLNAIHSSNSRSQWRR